MDSCYSDHDHDISYVGACEMCGGAEFIGRAALYKAQREAEAFVAEHFIFVKVGFNE